MLTTRYLKLNCIFICTIDINKIYQLNTKQQTTKLTLQILYNNFGEEFVCRIGNYAIILKE